MSAIASKRCLRFIDPPNSYSRSAIFMQQPTCRKLHPATHHRPSYLSHRAFSSTPRHSSHVGGAPLKIPRSVSFQVSPSTAKAKTRRRTDDGSQLNTSTVDIKGPLGELKMELPHYVTVEHDSTAGRAVVSIKDQENKIQRSMWGTTRAYLRNYIIGVSEGHITLLRLVGVGYRASIESTATTVASEYSGQQFVNLKLGYSHPIEMPIPLGVKASVPVPTRILLEGPEKDVVNQFAAKIRKWRIPEPYKGKGIFVGDETIKLKSKKIK